MSKKRGLGKGLSALLENANTDITNKKEYIESVGAVTEISISNIEANPFQPRTDFEKEALIELVNSIKVHGIIQPITLRKIGYGKYQIISGERRFRASQIVGLESVPAFVRVANDQEMLEMAIVENVQRQDLNSIEVALSFQRLIDECGLTQEQLSEKVGKNRSTVTNFLRLLRLPEEIQIGIRDQKISMGHARALLSFKDEKEMIGAYQKILNENLSVRKTEELSKVEKVQKEEKSDKKKFYSLSLEEKNMLQNISKRLDSKVNVKKEGNGSGKIQITFEDEAHFDKIMSLLDA